MADIEIKRGYEILPDNNIRFGVRVINSSDSAISDVEVILDYNESLFELEGSKIQKLGAIPPTLPRTVKFILKPLGCIHYEEIGATILYKDHTWKKNTQNMHPKEIHCVCPFLKDKPITRTEFLSLLNSGYMEERGINFENITPDKLIEFLSQTCNNRLYKVDEFSIENSKVIYLAGDALGEKAYYLLTVVIKEYEGITQVLMRANSDKSHGLNRIYITGDSKDSDGAIYELSYDGQNWQYITVSDSVTADHMTIANARNDGINCLYTGSSRGISEYTFSGTWVKTSNIKTGFEVNGLAVGNGRNDGINRIYVTGDDNHLYEYNIE